MDSSLPLMFLPLFQAGCLDLAEKLLPWKIVSKSRTVYRKDIGFFLDSSLCDTAAVDSKAPTIDTR